MMSKKILEIVSAIGSVLLLIVLLIIVNSVGAAGYGFVASLLAFVLIVSAIGFGLANVE